MNSPLGIEKLRGDHIVTGFDCGREELNRFLVRFALAHQQAGTAMSFDLQHQIWPVEHDPELIEDVATEQDVGLIITGQNLDHAGRQITDLDLDQESRESHEMSTDSEDGKFAELVEMQLVGQSPRYDRQIGGGVELSGAFRDGRILRDRTDT